MATTYDLTGGAVASSKVGLQVLRSNVISVVGAVVNDVWKLWKLPAGTRVLATLVDVVADGVASSLYDVGFDSGNEIANDVDAATTAVVNGGLEDRLETSKYLTVKAVTMASAPEAGSFRVTAIVAQM